MINEQILPLIPKDLVDEFSYLLGLFDGRKDEFLDKTYQQEIKVVENLELYNDDKYNVIDGKALKMCDRFAAYMEATLSIHHGVKSNELINGKKQIQNKIKNSPSVNGVDFGKLIDSVEEYLRNSSQDDCGT